MAFFWLYLVNITKLVTPKLVRARYEKMLRSLP